MHRGILNSTVCWGEWEPNSVPCPPGLCSKHSTHPDRKKSTLSPKTLSEGQCNVVEQTCRKPHKKSVLKRSRRVPTERACPAAQGPTSARQPARRKWEKSAKPTMFGQEQGSITRVYHVIRPQQGKKKQERKLSRGDTHLRTPLWAMSSEAQRDKGKKEVKKGSISDWNQQNKNFVKKKFNNDSAISMSKAWNSKDRTCHDCRWHDSTYRT